MVNGVDTNVVEETGQEGRHHQMQSLQMEVTSTIDTTEMNNIRDEADRSDVVMAEVRPVKSENDVHHPAYAVTEQVEEAEIEKFLEEHPPTCDDINRRDIKVAELRRIIPLLIIRQFNIRKDPTQKKVKGMWNERPKGWPMEVPYLDPNNTQKGEKGKPSQKTLLKMFSFLMRLYVESQGSQYPAQAETPIRHNFTSSGSPVAMAATEAATFTRTESSRCHFEEINDDLNRTSPLHLQSTTHGSTFLTHPATTVSTAESHLQNEQSKLQPVLQSIPSTAGMQSQILSNSNINTPQALQQTIIIKTTPSLFQQVTPVDINLQETLVNQHALQSVQGMDLQKYLACIPVLSQPVVSAASPQLTDDKGPLAQHIVTSQAQQLDSQTLSRTVEADIPTTLEESPGRISIATASQENSVSMASDALDVLSATAARTERLPVPGTSQELNRSREAVQPPATQLHVIQPASSARPQHEVMDTTPTPTTPESTPVQVEEDDWNPYTDLKQQYGTKLAFLGKKKLLSEASTASLNIIRDLLDKMYVVRDHDPEFFLSTAHDFVCTLDIAKATGKVPETQLTKWREFEGPLWLQLQNLLRNVYQRVIAKFGDKGKGPSENEATPTIPTETNVNRNSAFDFEELGIKQVTVGTMQQLQMEGELNLRIIHNKEDIPEPNPEVEAIKNNLKCGDNNLRSPHSLPEIPSSPAHTPSSKSSEQHFHDLEEVLIRDSMDDAITRSENYEFSGMVGTMSVEKDLMKHVQVRETNPSISLIPHRNTPMMISPGQKREHQFSQHENDRAVVDSHRKDTNVQPPGNSMAGELLEEISAKGFAERKLKASLYEAERSCRMPNLNEDRSALGMRTLASAYINQLANIKVSEDSDVSTYANDSMIPTVVGEVQDGFCQSDAWEPYRKKAFKRLRSGSPA